MDWYAIRRFWPSRISPVFHRGNPFEFAYYHCARCGPYSHKSPITNFYLCVECLFEHCKCAPVTSRLIESSTRKYIEWDIAKRYLGPEKYYKAMQEKWKHPPDDDQRFNTLDYKLSKLPKIWINSVRYYVRLIEILKVLPKPRARCPICHKALGGRFTDETYSKLIWFRTADGSLRGTTTPPTSWLDKARLRRTDNHDCVRAYMIDKHRRRKKETARRNRSRLERRRHMTWLNENRLALKTVKKWLKNQDA